MQYHQPNDLTEALHIKAYHGQDGYFLAGGTDLVVLRNRGHVKGRVWIDLSQIPELNAFEEGPTELRIGAMCPHARLENSRFVALAEAAASVGGPQIRNRGTVGGNVANASPAGDVSVALLAYDAQVELKTLRSERRLPLAEFFVGPGKTLIEPDEVITAFYLPTDVRAAWLKVGKRDATAISVVAAAVGVRPSGRVHVALGSVAPTPLRLTSVETILAEKGLSPDSIQIAGEMVREAVRPITDHRASAGYRRDVAGSVVARLLGHLWASAAG